MQNLIPNLGLLRHQIEEAIEPSEFRKLYFQLELLPYSLGATYQAFFDFIREERDLVNSTIAHDTDQKVIHAVGAGGRDPLCYRIDTFLEAARRTQNAVIPYLSKVLSISSPSSLSELVKKIENKKIILPDKLAADLTGYWNNQGKRLKDYRDLGQHFSLVASEVRIFYSEQGKPAIYLTLPNNPEVKNPLRLVFDKPPVHAFGYMKEQLHWLIKFCHCVTIALTGPIDGPQRVVSASIVFRNPLLFGTGVRLSGHLIRNEEEAQNEIEELVKSLDRI